MAQLSLPPPVIAATPISISIPTLIVELLIFLGMVFLMERLVFAPIRTAWRERNQQIEAGLQATTTTRDEAEEARREVRQILGEARRQAQRSIDEVSTEGERIRTERIEEATNEFQRLLTEARVQIQAEEAQASAQMRNLVIDLALEAASKVTGAQYANPETRQLAAAVVGRQDMAQ